MFTGAVFDLKAVHASSASDLSRSWSRRAGRKPENLEETHEDTGGKTLKPPDRVTELKMKLVTLKMCGDARTTSYARALTIIPLTIYLLNFGIWKSSILQALRLNCNTMGMNMLLRLILIL